MTYVRGSQIIRNIVFVRKCLFEFANSRIETWSKFKNYGCISSNCYHVSQICLCLSAEFLQYWKVLELKDLANFRYKFKSETETRNSSYNLNLEHLCDPINWIKDQKYYNSVSHIKKSRNLHNSDFLILFICVHFVRIYNLLNLLELHNFHMHKFLLNC